MRAEPTSAVYKKLEAVEQSMVCALAATRIFLTGWA
jgi:hypothetical protein